MPWLTRSRFSCVGVINIVFPLGHFGVGAWGAASEDSTNLSEVSIVNAWIANAPQVLLPFCYVGLNNICTFMAAVEEWNHLASTRKGLRVSRPMAEQRSTYFLQLPYQWALPLIIMSGMLHWLLSQSFFLVVVFSYGAFGGGVFSRKFAGSCWIL
jgi:hypothetical protein